MNSPVPQTNDRPMDRRFSVAPMMDWTDRHCRSFHRLLSARALLYSEMITAPAVLHGDRVRLLAMNSLEHPVALQLGGSDPEELALAAEHGQAAGFDEINLNVGCPSDRVQSGRFGACLFREPGLVRQCIAAMRARVDLPVTVKTRIGVDDDPIGEPLWEFVETVAESGCEVFVIHARKAWLEGLSPKQNREVPPLCYETVYEIKQRYPELTVVINGGIEDLDAARIHLREVDGVMMGRAAYHDPWLLARIDAELFDEIPRSGSREQVVHDWIPYVESQLTAGVPLQAMTRHVLGLFQGVPGARMWRRHISENAHRDGAGVEVLTDALEAMSEIAAFAA